MVPGVLQTLINYPLQTHTEVGVGVPLGLRVWLSECVSACLSSRHCLQTARMTAGPCVSFYCCFLRSVEESPPPPPLKYVFEVGSGVFQNLVTYPLQTPIEVGVGVPQAPCLSSKQPCLRASRANTACKLLAWPPGRVLSFPPRRTSTAFMLLAWPPGRASVASATAIKKGRKFLWFCTEALKCIWLFDNATDSKSGLPPRPTVHCLLA